MNTPEFLFKWIDRPNGIGQAGRIVFYGAVAILGGAYATYLFKFEFPESAYQAISFALSTIYTLCLGVKEILDFKTVKQRRYQRIVALIDKFIADNKVPPDFLAAFMAFKVKVGLIDNHLTIDDKLNALKVFVQNYLPDIFDVVPDADDALKLDTSRIPSAEDIQVERSSKPVRSD